VSLISQRRIFEEFPLWITKLLILTNTFVTYK
jgi:hypothetical protein